MKIILGCVVIFGICIALATGFTYSKGLIGWKEVLGALLAFSGTLFGALAAFALNQLKDLGKEKKEQKAAIDKAIFIVFRQHNAVLNFSVQIKHYQTQLERSFNCPAFKLANYDDLRFDFKELGFLLENEDADILFKLSVEQEGFQQTMDSIRIRNDYYLEKFQPLLASSGLNGKKFSGETLKNAVGELVYGSCMQSTATMYQNVEKSLIESLKTAEELRTIGKKRFPDAKFPQIGARNA